MPGSPGHQRRPSLTLEQSAGPRLSQRHFFPLLPLSLSRPWNSSVCILHGRLDALGLGPGPLTRQWPGLRGLPGPRGIPTCLPESRCAGEGLQCGSGAQAAGGRCSSTQGPPCCGPPSCPAAGRAGMQGTLQGCGCRLAAGSGGRGRRGVSEHVALGARPTPGEPGSATTSWVGLGHSLDTPLVSIG